MSAKEENKINGDVSAVNGETSRRTRKTSLQRMMLETGAAVDPFYTERRLRRDLAKLDDVGEFDALKESRLLVLYTGGTIGMKSQDGVYSPYPNYLVSELRKLPLFHDQDYVQATALEVPEERLPLAMPLSKEGKRILYTVWEYDPLLDSCNITMTDWAQLAYDIKKTYEQFDGFVVLHGTDTMAYTASALSFMLEFLGKPVILTGSQIPIFETRSDGRDNLLGALIVAGHYCIPEVMVYFNNKLLRGNRTTKVDSGSFDAFHSPNLPPLASLEIDIHVNWTSVYRQTGLHKFTIQPNMNPHVAVLRLFPSITTSTVRAFLQPPMAGVVLQSYGAGNGPDARSDLLTMFKEASDRGVIIVNITQCARGTVGRSYASGEALFQAGILPGGDMTTEAALTKLSYILGQDGLTQAEKIKMLSSNIRGEMRVLSATDDDDKPGLSELPLIERLQEALKISSEEEVVMLKDSVYPSLLCSSAKDGNLDALQQLMDAGALFYQSDYDGRTALHVAASEGHVELMSYLLSHGAPVHQRDRYGHTPLDDAVAFNKHEAIRLLIQTGAHLNLMPFKQGTKLCHAAMQDDVTSLQSWHLAGADINQGDYDNRTALHVAVSHENLSHIKFLLEHGADCTIRDNFGFTAIDEAKRRGFSHIAESLSQNSS